MKIKNTFVQGKLNKDLDERLLPNGQYPDALNVRVANTDSSDVGAIENVKGNERLTNLNLNNAITIGAFADNSNQKLYWFVTSDDKDLVFEYDMVMGKLYTVLESSKPDGVLNFDKNYLITGIIKIVNEDRRDDLLGWTDDRNNPRLANIERCKKFAPDGFEEDDICLIKKPPRYAPNVSLVNNTKFLNNNIEDKFLSFAYRYKYLDGEYSALSSFTNYQFQAFPDYNFDNISLTNLGMVNMFNSVNIEFNSGSKRVTDIDVVFKYSNSNSIYVIQTINKKEHNYEDNKSYSMVFSNDKIYRQLPEDEIYRLYDNVPRLAKALDVIGNRLVFGNFLENYDIVDKDGLNINIDYNVNYFNNNVKPIFITDYVSRKKLHLNFKDIKQFKKGDIIGLNFGVKGSHDLEAKVSAGYKIQGNHNSLKSFLENEQFEHFVETTLTNFFDSSYKVTAPDNTVKTSIKTPFKMTVKRGTIVVITAPVLEFKVDNTPNITIDEDFSFVTTTSRLNLDTDDKNYITNEISMGSVKSDRTYSVVMIYMDEYGRKTTALNCLTSEVHIPYFNANRKNYLQIEVNHKPPYWADRYKFAIKQNNFDYQTIYTNVYYKDNNVIWFKLDSDNKDKLKKGDYLILKNDYEGFKSVKQEYKVLDIKEQPKDFIEGNSAGVEPAGLYFKVKSSGISLNEKSNKIYETKDKDDNDDGYAWVLLWGRNNEIFNYRDGGTWKEREIPIDSTFDIHYNSNRISLGTNDTFKIKIKASKDYDNFIDFFNTETKNLKFICQDSKRTIEHIGVSRRDGQIILAARSIDKGYNNSWGVFDGEYVRMSMSGRLYISGTTYVFETRPLSEANELYYETEDTFEIKDGFHLGNNKNQSNNNPAVIDLKYFNCFSYDNGVESYRYKDGFNTPYMNNDLRPTSIAEDKYREIRRYADLTYSEPYNANANVNGLNEFNLYRANYKDDIDKKYGYIQKLHARDNDLLVFQEDKVSKVLYGKDLLMNADGSSNLSGIDSVLGQQIPYTGEYGISRNPESFAYDGFFIYFTDTKRGAVMRLANNGLEEISANGLRQYFKDEFKNLADSKKLGGFDPYYDQYVLYSSRETLTPKLAMTCSDYITKSGFYGEMLIEIDYGLISGDYGISYETNGVPIKFDIELEGNVVKSTGFVGDASYNSELQALGFGTVVNNGRGTLMDIKQMLPKVRTIRVFTPLCGAKFTLAGICPVKKDKTLKIIILNSSEDIGTSVISRFRWKNGNFISPYGTYFSRFIDVSNENNIDTFDTISGKEGEYNLPFVGSELTMETFKPLNSRFIFTDKNKLGYLSSNTNYNKEDISALLSAGITYPNINRVENNNNETFSIKLPIGQEKYNYLIYDYRDPEVVINIDTKIRIYFDSSGSMNSTLSPLTQMRNTLLKNRLLPLYNNDSDLYDNSVVVRNFAGEDTINALNMFGETPEGNVIILVFQDESSAYGTDNYNFDPATTMTSNYKRHLKVFRDRLDTFAPNYYRAVLFRVDGYSGHRAFVKALRDGEGLYTGDLGLADREEFNYRLDVQNGGTPQHYMDLVVESLKELGYEL